jgi:PhnB protein
VALNPETNTRFQPTLAPWLSVRNGDQAVEFYKSAFNATEVHRLDGPEGLAVARLSINGADFWIGAESPEHTNPKPDCSQASSIRIILTVPNPDATFAQALTAGATEVYPVQDGHGWRIGRVVDPFGYHWEIGHPLG